MVAPQVNFYRFESDEVIDPFVFRLTQQIVEKGQRILIRFDTKAEVDRFDERLWSGHWGFISHEIVQSDTPKDSFDHQVAQVLIAEGDCLWPCPVLLNFCQDLPKDYDKFEKIAEMIGLEPAQTKRARQRYKLYQEKTCQVKFHEIKDHLEIPKNT